MKSKIYLLLLTRQVKCGFTLLELLAASMMTIFVVLAAGYGTMVVMRENTASSVASDTQYNLNRAADYITDEVKSATSIFTTFPTSSSDSNYTQCNVSPYTPVLGIKSVSTTTTHIITNTIVYCLKQTDGSEVWLGKNVVYRATTEKSQPLLGGSPITTSTINALIDLIADTPQSSDCQNSGWTKIPTTPKGFFVCVDQTTGKMVELHLNASAVDINDSKAKTTSWMGSDTNTRFGDKATYEVVTQVYARAPSDLAISVSPTSISAGSTTPLVFTVRRAGDTSQAITVNLTATPPNSAKFSPNPITSTLSLSAGESSKTLTITPTGSPNALASGDSLAISIASGTGYAIGTGSATVTVTAP